MSPPAATFENPIAIDNVAMPAKKDLAVDFAVKPAVGGHAKTLAGMEEKWESFTFSPIRESQVSRAMSTSSYILALLLQLIIISSSLLCRP